MAHARSRFKDKRGKGNMPAMVDLKSAIAFCAWLGGKLPTEDQWEAAARGGDGSRTFPWGERVPKSSPEDCDLMTGFFHASMDPPIDFNCGGRLLAKVGSHPAGCTPEGVCDLAGNADEFVVPGAVVWKEERQPDTDVTAIVAHMPGFLTGDDGQKEFLRTCDWLATSDPYGLVSGKVSDCVEFTGDNRATTTVSHSYPSENVRAVLRGGNYDDSLPVLYQTRARYPYADPTKTKGFRCTM
jgi:formylglycine-generating enzyme required for sulfatase activity